MVLEKAALKEKKPHRRSNLVLKPQNGDCEGSKSTFLPQYIENGVEGGVPVLYFVSKIIYLHAFVYHTMCTRPVVPGGAGAGLQWHPHFLADQLTLSQTRGADYAHQIILAPPDFQTF